MPAFVKGITRLKRLRRAVDLVTSEDITPESPESLASYFPDRARKIVEDLDEQINRLVELKEKVLGAQGSGGVRGYRLLMSWVCGSAPVHAREQVPIIDDYIRYKLWRMK